MIFDKNKELQVQVTGQTSHKTVSIICLDKDNDWSFGDYGISFYRGNSYILIPWQRIMEINQDAA